MDAIYTVALGILYASSRDVILKHRAKSLRVHMGPQLDPVLSQISVVHTGRPLFFKARCNVFLSSTSCSFKRCLPFRF